MSATFQLGGKRLLRPLATEVFNDKLREWEDYYNYHRPHGGLGS